MVPRPSKNAQCPNAVGWTSDKTHGVIQRRWNPVDRQGVIGVQEAPWQVIQTRGAVRTRKAAASPYTISSWDFFGECMKRRLKLKSFPFYSDRDVSGNAGYWWWPSGTLWYLWVPAEKELWGPLQLIAHLGTGHTYWFTSRSLRIGRMMRSPRLRPLQRCRLGIASVYCS